MINKKQPIPKKIRQLVWNNHIGELYGKHVCMCCKSTEISQMNFQCGHIISEYNKGTCTIDNLVPICNLCNTSMGRTNMDTFITKHGLDTSNINDIINKSKKKNETVEKKSVEKTDNNDYNNITKKKVKANKANEKLDNKIKKETMIKKPAKPRAGPLAKKQLEESTKKPKNESVKKQLEESTKKPKKELIKEPKKEPKKESVKEPIKEPKKEPVKEPKKKQDSNIKKESNNKIKKIIRVVPKNKVKIEHCKAKNK